MGRPGSALKFRDRKIKVVGKKATEGEGKSVG